MKCGLKISKFRRKMAVSGVTGETANTAICRRFFLPFLAELYISELFEPNLFFPKNYPNTFLVDFWLNSKIFEISVKCKNVGVILLRKK